MAASTPHKVCPEDQRLLVVDTLRQRPCELESESREMIEVIKRFEEIAREPNCKLIFCRMPAKGGV